MIQSIFPFAHGHEDQMYPLQVAGKVISSNILPRPTSMIEFLRSCYRRLIVWPRLHEKYEPLSVAEVFQTIYESGEWGEGSGTGSRGPAASQYIEDVCSFITSHHIKSVVDLGCGDFHIGRAIIEKTSVAYTGVDVVPSLIESHSRNFPASSFVCANLITDSLPQAELCLVRQVFQHLSNAEIEAALRNIRHYPMVLISEHVPVRPKSFNRDKPHGPDVRAYYGSGVYPDKAPFSVPIAALWERELQPGALLRTVLVTRD